MGGSSLTVLVVLVVLEILKWEIQESKEEVAEVEDQDKHLLLAEEVQEFVLSTYLDIIDIPLKLIYNTTEYIIGIWHSKAFGIIRPA